MAKVAIVVLANTESHEGLGRVVNALVTAKEFKEHHDELRLIFDGAGTQGLASVAQSDSKAHALFEETREVITGACSYCAVAFGVRETLRENGIPLLDEYAHHPSLRTLITEGFQVLTF